MQRKRGLILLIAAIVLSFTTAASAAPHLFYSEDFSSYPVDSFPPGWEIVYNGAGNSEQHIADVDGNNVLRSRSQSGWSAVLRHDFNSMADIITYSFDALIPSGGTVRIGNGTLKATVGGAAQNKWANYVLEIDFSKGVYDLYVDGVLERDGASLTVQDPSVAWAQLSANPGMAIDTGHNTGNDIAMIDNIQILEFLQAVYSYYSHNTVCIFGPHFRDVSPELTDKWYMFTPVDLSQDGVQTYPLVGGGAYAIGELRITVSGDDVTVTYQYANDGVWPEGEFFTLFPDYGSITTVNPEELEPLFAYGEPISIANDLHGDTSVILFVRNVVTFRDDNPEIVRFWENIPEYKTQREQMLTLLDGSQGY